MTPCLAIKMQSTDFCFPSPQNTSTRASRAPPPSTFASGVWDPGISRCLGRFGGSPGTWGALSSPVDFIHAHRRPNLGYARHSQPVKTGCCSCRPDEGPRAKIAFPRLREKRRVSQSDVSSFGQQHCPEPLDLVSLVLGPAVPFHEPQLRRCGTLPGTVSQTTFFFRPLSLTGALRMTLVTC